MPFEWRPFGHERERLTDTLAGQTPTQRIEAPCEVVQLFANDHLEREREFAAMESLGVARRLVRLHAAEAEKAEEELLVEPVLRPLRDEVLAEQLDFPCAVSSANGTNTAGLARSPSYFGISYSKIR